ncbi:hypothetical protein V492_07322 [Pseudogymnoascus sp. VKM F-4246]|nr:hypothetical protein V492_07322 [Pseudogymnoascus sp. VKM F-4246]
MSDYTGPGVYEISPANALGKRVSAWGGATTSGTAVKLYSPAQAENLIWEIVAAGGERGDPETGNRQYHIIGVQSGLLLCAAQDGTDTDVTLSTRSVRHGSSRWEIIPAKNGYYQFASALNRNKWLAVRGQLNADGTPLMTYAKTDAPHFQFKLSKPNF